ncbi:MAG: hypothetical protein FVQ77_16455 [Cytophagales bacterium]|nr:hypothetical protein [Cytophagales bacterium]
MNTLTYLSAILLISNAAYSQIDTTIWNDLQKVQTEYYELSVPSVWANLDHMIGYGKEQIFEATGKGLPFSYNDAMVSVKVTLSNIKAQNLNEVKKNTTNKYTKYTDRIFEKNYTYDEDSLTLASGEKVYLLHTRFYRESDTEHHSKFDLVAYSSKAKAGYRYSMLIQYHDKTYELEKKYHLREFAKKLFSYFTLK